MPAKQQKTPAKSETRAELTGELHVPLFWLTYHRSDEIAGAVIIESSAVLPARMKALASGLDRGFTFAHGRALDAEQTALVPQHAIGRMLTLAEAERLLASFQARKSLTKPRSRL